MICFELKSNFTTAKKSGSKVKYQPQSGLLPLFCGGKPNILPATNPIHTKLQLLVSPNPSLHAATNYRSTTSNHFALFQL